MAVVAMTSSPVFGQGVAAIARAAVVPPAAIYKDWAVRCPTASARDGFCEIAQQVKAQAGSERPVLQVAMSCNVRQRRCAIQLGLPPGVVVEEDGLLSVDTAVPLALPILDCDRARCLAGGVLPLAFGEGFARAAHVTVRFHDRPTGAQSIALSVDGLTQAFADMVGRNMTIAANAASVSTGEGNIR